MPPFPGDQVWVGNGLWVQAIKSPFSVGTARPRQAVVVYQGPTHGRLTVTRTSAGCMLMMGGWGVPAVAACSTAQQAGVEFLERIVEHTAEHTLLMEAARRMLRGLCWLFPPDQVHALVRAGPQAQLLASGGPHWWAQTLQQHQVVQDCAWYREMHPAVSRLMCRLEAWSGVPVADCLRTSFHDPRVRRGSHLQLDFARSDLGFGVAVAPCARECVEHPTLHHDPQHQRGQRAMGRMLSGCD